MSVDANQIATKGDLEQLLLKLEQRLAAAQPATPAADEYLTLDEVAKATRTSVRTVKKWITEGKYDLKGKRITLFALEFSDGYYRVPRAALVAYGSKMGFTAADLTTIPPLRLAS
ncbi:helix-turn-helix domain-containing protein [Hymenobacter metallicola]|uniref:DNA-binding protein n=1 Tax=Hymenobacter metallicola TaxID=2563114 RepID=A0A4Z0QCZ3_9BACT|nr:helix-turn-helix domain-containing protein [Hymenobacter metallicola]TGE26911.1 DNA-binding protein [Hymenobacter metallicola]